MKNLLKPDLPLILASDSPRRREILESLGFTFEVYSRKYKVEPSEFRHPGDFVVEIAEKKAKEPVTQFDKKIVLAADTIVYIDGVMLGKPQDDSDAYRMIKKLQGATHQVYTGINLSVCSKGSSRSTYAVTDVTFAPMSNKEIEWYIDTGEYHDKAGAYAIQGKASLFISGVNGCFYNVVGLPIHTFYKLLQEITVSITKV
ncbi:hypothetical protein AMJ80_12210 [bacterium SM23_31]|nr:MAG: hypothetical protein AMJ80_12210 [bacterium SM23_31]